ncbi:MAG: diguanylate cyclase [Elusimicrobia bacterium]|nr:diguanylate cyclase [Elusimicrobiota bacterium]
MDEVKSIEELESEGYRVIDAIAGDVPLSKELQYIVDKIVAEKRGTFYSDILYNMTSERFSEAEAKNLWQEILRHKYVISELFKRNVGVRVAALDYLENIKKLITAPKIIDETEFRETLKLAETDPLTGIFNRRVITREISDEIKNSKKQGYFFSVLMIDLDRFKDYNDSEGHTAGDLILQEVAGIFKSELRKQDMVGRYGGDEFIIVLSKVEKPQAKKIAEKIRLKVENEFKTINITVSIGIAEFPTDGITMDDLISSADEALYRAKEFGKNRVVFFKFIGISYKTKENVNSVTCVGDFNRWNKKQGPMQYLSENGEWVINLNLKPGVYRYKFLVDGTKWIADPGATEFVDDGFGGQCSILKVNLD